MEPPFAPKPQGSLLLHHTQIGKRLFREAQALTIRPSPPAPFAWDATSIAFSTATPKGRGISRTTPSSSASRNFLSSPTAIIPSALTGSEWEGAPATHTTLGTSVPGAVNAHTAPRAALERNALETRTPYLAHAWERVRFTLPVVRVTQALAIVPPADESIAVFQQLIERESAHVRSARSGNTWVTGESTSI
ncbi:uncharacterized protein B0H18DRAFT_433936 [Fomitopsis serialis]|uniref:uncharacterized protein n=1 Tax=Fomitopsis serialis TaxID=139415 RepID=UPI002008DB49|nr:uncharacterized protein B0H18DRAFT_433936 [Neoantrodia serialis]KAH9910754.1 hypothetical protein B0H18DRAFT_433936 [Neoantrodia serialis]